MSKETTYKIFIIRSTPRHLPDSMQWTPSIAIEWERDGTVTGRPFSAETIHPTEAEADLHGLIYAMRIIDGKVEGQSVMNLKTEERRAMPRLRVQFRTTFAGASQLEGLGLMHDLSSGGCRIESPVPVAPGFSLELRIHVPDLEWPLMIDAARVQWVSGLMFGLAFFRLRETEQHRLEQVINALMEGDTAD